MCYPIQHDEEGKHNTLLASRYMLGTLPPRKQILLPSAYAPWLLCPLSMVASCVGSGVLRLPWRMLIHILYMVWHDLG